MIEIMQGLPENVVGISASGNVSKEDYQNILIPALKQAIEKHDKVRIYYKLGKDFSGIEFSAMWEDMWFGIGNMSHWEKIAVVTDVDWIQNGVGIFRFVMTCPVKVFPNSDSSQALSWISNPNS